MIRLALGARWSGCTTPVHRSRTRDGDGDSSPPFKRLGSSSEASARVPIPVVERPRNARRWMRLLRSSVEWKSIASIPGHGLMEVEDHAGYGGPGGQLGRVDPRRDRGLPDVQQVAGRGGILLILPMVFEQEALQDRDPFGTRRTP